MTHSGALRTTWQLRLKRQSRCKQTGCAPQAPRAPQVPRAPRTHDRYPNSARKQFAAGFQGIRSRSKLQRQGHRGNRASQNHPPMSRGLRARHIFRDADAGTGFYRSEKRRNTNTHSHIITQAYVSILAPGRDENVTVTPPSLPPSVLAAIPCFPPHV